MLSGVSWSSESLTSGQWAGPGRKRRALLGIGIYPRLSGVTGDGVMKKTAKLFNGRLRIMGENYGHSVKKAIIV